MNNILIHCFFKLCVRQLGGCLRGERIFQVKNKKISVIRVISGSISFFDISAAIFQAAF